MEKDLENALEKARKPAVYRLLGNLGIVALIMSAIGGTLLLFSQRKKERQAGRPEGTSGSGETVAPEEPTEAHVKKLEQQHMQDAAKSR
jgi:hypothetical protein